MSKKISVAEVKRDFSAVLNEVSTGRAQFVIEKNGKPMVAMVSIEDLQVVEEQKRRPRQKGLLAAIGAWEDFPDIEKTIEDIYDERRESKDRSVQDLT